MIPHSAIRRLLAFALAAAVFAVVGQASAFAAGAPSVENVAVSVTPGGAARITATVNGNGEATTFRGLWHSGHASWCYSNGTSGNPAEQPTPLAITPVDTADHAVEFDFTGLPVGETLCAGIEAVNASGTTLIQYSSGFTPTAAVEIPPPSAVNANAVTAPAPRCFIKKNVSTSKSFKGRKYTLAGKRSASSQAFTFSIGGAKGVSYSLGSATLKTGTKSPWSVTVPASKIANHAWLYATVDTGQTRVKLRIRLVTMAC